MEKLMIDLHAIADGWQDAAGWRDGTKRVRSWSVRDVATGSRLATVRVGDDGVFLLETGTGCPTSHGDLSLALASARDALSPGTLH